MVKLSAIEIALCIYLQPTLLTSALNNCTEEYRNGVKLSTNSVFRTQIQNSLGFCQKSCIATASCEAFTYNHPNMTCLYGSAGSEFESTTDMDFVTSPIKWKPAENENLIRPCTHSTCQNGSECKVRKNGNVVCIKTATECTDSPFESSSTIESIDHERTVGHSVPLFCDDGFLLTGNPKMTCKGNGQWTDGTCTECWSVTHYNTYEIARQHCLSQGKQLLQYDHTSPKLPYTTQVSGRCKTCPGDVVADLHKRYLESDCTTGYTNKSFCSCHFTTAVPDMKMMLTIEFLNLETSFDFLHIYDGKDATYPYFGRYTGSTQISLVTYGTDAFMVLETDLKKTTTGFRLSYVMVSPDVTSFGPKGNQLIAFPTFLWLDGTFYPVQKTFQAENGNSYSFSTPDVYDFHSRLCYDPVTDKIEPFSKNDYCNTYFETP